MGNVRLTPFPLPVSKRVSEYNKMRQAKRLGFADRPWFKESQRRYATVEIAHKNGRWWLAYNGKASTGAFKSRTEAVRWFMRGGR